MASVSHRPSPAAFRLAGLIGVLLLAAGLRFHQLGAQSYWHDEGNSRVLAGQTVEAILRSAAADIHPPAYYLALKGWRALLGESEFGLRGFSALASLVLVALLYRLGREGFGPRAGLLAALLGAVNPFLVYYAQEARMYALAATLGTASFWLLSAWLKEPSLGKAIAYGLVTALGLYTHYSFAFILIAQNLAVLIFSLLPLASARSRSSRFFAWLVLQAITLLLYLPWLPTAYHQLTTWPAAREFKPFGPALLDLTRYLAFGRTLPTGEATWGLIGVGGLLLLSPFYAILAKRSNSHPVTASAFCEAVSAPGQGIASSHSALLAMTKFTHFSFFILHFLWLLVPAGLTLAFGLLSETFSKFLLIAVPALCLLLAAGHPSSSPRHFPFRLLYFSFFIFHFSFTAFSLFNLYTNPAYFRDDYRGLARYIESVERPGDAVLLIAPNQIEAFSYYHRSGAEIFPLPATRPLDPAQTTATLERLAAQYQRFFVLYWADEQADPDHFVEGWLNTHTFKAADRWYGQVRLVTYAVATPAAAPAVASGARFGEHITLAGYTLNAATLAPGDIAQITFFWRTDAPLGERYKVFVHLYADPFQPPPAQQDGEPGGDLRPTSGWLPGQTYADNHGVALPTDLPSGQYTLAVGLYNLFDGVRLGITSPASSNGDRLELTTITIK